MISQATAVINPVGKWNPALYYLVSEFASSDDGFLWSLLWLKEKQVFLLCFQDVVKVGAVDADKHQSLGGQYGVQGFPTIKIFGSNKNKPEDYQGKNFS